MLECAGTRVLPACGQIPEESAEFAGDAIHFSWMAAMVAKANGKSPMRSGNPITAKIAVAAPF